LRYLPSHTTFDRSREFVLTEDAKERVCLA
jgi:hypothetical protein